MIDKPYSVVAPALARPAHWCDILTLQVNVKRCNASDDTLAAFITRKPREPVDSAHRVDFRFQLAATKADYLHVALRSRTGPVGTRDYEIVLEAAPLDARRTFMHMSYAYTLGSMARLAMDAYLAGAGRDKVGFSVVERLPDGRPVHVNGVRGVVERNAMRYYLAVEAHLESQNLETRLRHWYAATARYPQLRETVGLDEYVQMKRREASAPRTAVLVRRVFGLLDGDVPQLDHALTAEAHDVHHGDRPLLRRAPSPWRAAPAAVLEHALNSTRAREHRRRSSTPARRGAVSHLMQGSGLKPGATKRS